MTFWLILNVMTLIAVSVALWPLAFAASPKEDTNSEMAFYAAQLAEIDRDIDRGLLPAAEASAARAETARRLLAKRGEAVAAGGRDSRLRRGLASGIGLAAIVGIGIGVYGALGNPAVADQPQAQLQAQLKDSPHQDDPVFKAIAKIEEDVAASPNNVKAWSALAPIYLRVGRYADSVIAYRKLIELTGETADLRANLGEAETAAAEGKVTPEARSDFDKSLALDPNQAMAQYYLGLAAEQAGDVKAAVEIYEKVLPKVSDRPHWGNVIRNRVATLKGETAAAVVSSPAEGARSDDAIQGMVSRLATRLADKGGTAEEWLRLIRSYGVMEQTDKARAALAAALAAHGGDAKAKSDLDAIAQEFQLGAASAAPAAVARAEAPAKPVSNDPVQGNDMVQGMVSRLAARLEDKGGTAEDWLRLIRSYGVMEQTDKARAALAAALKAYGSDAKSKSDLDAIAQEFQLGSAVAAPAAAAPVTAAAAPAEAPAKPVSNDMIQGMVSRLATRLEDKGGTTEEWLRLIRSYGVMEQTDKARAALAAGLKQRGGDAKAKAEFDAIAREFHLDAP
jgi:cytochrome c-type biogenesis protein CcmH